MKAAIGLFLLTAFVVAGLSIGAFALEWYTIPFFGKLEARQQIQSGSSRIVNYNHFFNLCASVQALEDRQAIALTSQDQAPNDFERYRVSQNIAGIAGLRAEAIRQYNQDALKDYTAGQFRDSDLPYQLSGEGKTKCAIE